MVPIRDMSVPSAAEVLSSNTSSSLVPFGVRTSVVSPAPLSLMTRICASVAALARSTSSAKTRAISFVSSVTAPPIRGLRTAT